MKDSVLIRWLLSFTKPFKGKMILAILLGILSNLAVVAIPVISTLTLLRLIAGDTVNLSLILTLLIGCGVVRGSLVIWNSIRTMTLPFRYWLIFGRKSSSL